MIERDKDGICDTCAALPPVFRRIRSAYEYTEKVKAIITTMKYRPSLRLCGVMGETLGEYARKGLWRMDWDFIVPIPSSPQSLRTRAFNQALILSNGVSEALREIRRVPINVDILYYVGAHKPQASLDHNARFANTRKMFEGRNAAEGRRILLVDDVLTTGATSNAAAESLLRKGARSIDLLTLARSSTWSESRRRFRPKIAG